MLVDLPRPRDDGGDARQPWREPGHRGRAIDERARRERAERDEHLRHVRLRGRVGLPRRPAGEERRGGRRRRRAAGPVRHRRVLTAARRARATACAGSRSCRRLASRLRAPPAALPAAGPRGASARHRGHETRSNRVRPRGRATTLSRTCSRIVVYELEGDLFFGPMERVYRRIACDSTTCDS